MLLWTSSVKTSADMIGQIEERLKELQIERPEQEAAVVEQTEELSAMQYAEQTIKPSGTGTDDFQQ